MWLNNEITNMFWLWIAILCAVSCWSNGVDAMKPHAHMSIKALCAGKTYEVKVKASDRVGEVCSALCRSNGINLDQQSVLYRGSVVNKKNTIKQAGIRAGGTIRIKSSMIRKSSGSGVDRGKVQSKSSVKSPGDVKANIDKLKSETLTGNDNGKWTNSKSKWDLKELQKMLSTDQSKTDTEFMKGLAASLQSNPMELVSELMKGNYLEDLVSDDAALVSCVMFLVMLSVLIVVYSSCFIGVHATNNEEKYEAIPGYVPRICFTSQITGQLLVYFQGCNQDGVIEYEDVTRFNHHFWWCIIIYF